MVASQHTFLPHLLREHEPLPAPEAAPAEARGATPIARLVAYDEHFVAPVRERGPLPDSSGIEALLRSTLGAAGWDAGTVDVVSATACGLPELDLLEAEALAAVFGAEDVGRRIALHTGVVGFTEAGHGPLGLVGVLQSMVDGQLAPTTGLRDPVAPLAGLAARSEARSAEVRRGLVLSVAPEGTMTALAVERVAAP